MVSQPKPIIMLMAEDDAGDRRLAQKALERSRLANDMKFVEDGEDLLDYLRRQGKYSDPATSPMPGIILLDLNMPRKDGREALQEIKSDPTLRHIPVIVLTTSKDEEDICRTYELGANSYITKPVTLTGLVNVMNSLEDYWFQIVELPADCSRG